MASMIVVAESSSYYNLLVTMFNGFAIDIGLATNKLIDNNILSAKEPRGLDKPSSLLVVMSIYFVLYVSLENC